MSNYVSRLYAEIKTYKPVEEIYEEYLRNDWGAPLAWLLHYDMAIELKKLPPNHLYAIAPQLDHPPRTATLLGIPVYEGAYDFQAAAIAGDPRKCRVGDFIKASDWVPSFYAHLNPVLEFRRSSTAYNPAGEHLWQLIT